tara:strand:- start:829 stop:966 length:138 start_codon:yes stop_codon:yes gene_type:complete
MSIDTSKIEHILRTKYGWDRFPLDEDVTKPKKKRKSNTSTGKQKN